MSRVDVTPVNDSRAHAKGADCWCEPRVLDEGLDDAGQPARVFVHHAADGREHAEPDHHRGVCAICREGAR